MAPAELLGVGAPIVPPVPAALEVPIVAPPSVNAAVPNVDVPDIPDADERVEFGVAVIFPGADEFLTWKSELNCTSKLLAILLMELATVIELLSALGPVMMNTPLDEKSVGEAPDAPPAIAIVYRPAVNDLDMIQTNIPVFDI